MEAKIPIAPNSMHTPNVTDFSCLHYSAQIHREMQRTTALAQIKNHHAITSPGMKLSSTRPHANNKMALFDYQVQYNTVLLNHDF